MHDEHAAHPDVGLIAAPNLRPVVFGETAARGVFAEPWPPAEVLAVTHEGDMIGYLVVDTLQPAPPLGGAGAYPVLSLRRARSLAAASTQQLALFGIRRGAHHAAVFVRRGESAPARVDELLRALEPLSARGAIEICFRRDSNGFAPAAPLSGIVASAVAATLVAVERAGIDPGAACFAVAGEDAAKAPFAAALDANGLARRELGPGATVDAVIAVGSAPVVEPRAIADAGARVVVGIESGGLSPAVERIVEQSGGIAVPEQIAGAGIFIAIDLAARGVPAEDVSVRVARAVSDATTSCLDEAAGTRLPLREVVTRRVLVTQGIEPPGRGRRPRAG